MQFLYNVAATTVLGKDVDGNDLTGFLFQPTAILIDLGAKELGEDGTELMVVTTTLTQPIEGGYVQQVRTKLLPSSLLMSAIDGFDIDTMKPVVNSTTLNLILANYDLILAP